MLPILFLVANFTYAQNNCGTEPSAEYLQELDAKIASQTGCSDDLSSYDLDQSITFNLVLNYAKEGNENGEFNETMRASIEADIANVYTPHNIYFNIIWNNLDCDECLINKDQWPEYLETSTCIQGHALSSYIPNNSGIGGQAADIGKGKFWGYPYAIPHELGHAIGLIHTHSNDESTTGYTDELVNRDSSDPCGCNCLQLGDRICDTPPDPNIGFPKNSAEIAHNQGMFSNCMLVNINNVLDDCDMPFSDPNQIITNNVMAYHCDNQSLPRMTDGQNHRIRMMMDQGDGTGTFKFQEDPNEMIFTQGLVVNTTTIKNSDEAFNGDIVVNSDLTIQGCTIELTEGHKIIVNAGANLTISNATIRTYTGSICYFPMEGKTKWEGIEINPGIGNFTNVSVHTNSTLNTSESGIYNPEGTSGLLNLTFNNSTLNGPAMDLSNTIGLQKLLKSNFDHSVNVTDNFYLKVEGCTFDFPSNSQESGIKALDTHLAVAKAHNGPNTTFTNCGNGIEFISSSAQSLRVSHTDFDNVLSGIDAKSVAGFLTAHDCMVKMRDFEIVGFGSGLLIDNFVDFEVYNNFITGSGSSLQDGIKIIYTGLNDNPNLLINNEISQCGFGIDSGSAELGNMISGIEFNCNDLSGILGNNFTTGKIGPHQGRGAVEGGDGTPAGNKFDGTPESSCSSIPMDSWEMWCNSDFNYVGGGWQYEQVYHYRDDEVAAGLPTENLEWDNSDEDPGFGKDQLNALLEPSCTYPVINNDPNPMPTSKTIRKNLLDGGDTDGSIDKVLDDSTTDPDGVLTEILDDSPWVSIPVVQALFANSQYYTEAEIADVIIQNPGVLDDPYINAIVFETTSFSASNQQLMIQAAEAGDIRVLHEQSLVDDILEGTLHIKEELYNQVTNGSFNEAVIRTLLDTKISNTKLYQTIESYVKEGDYTGAIATLNSRMGDRTFDPILVNEANVYGEILAFGAYLQSNGESWTKISNSDKSRLINIANTYNGLATKKARNTLEIYHGMTFGAMPTKPAYSPLSFLSIPRSVKNTSPLTLYPNPTSGMLHIDGADDALKYNIDIVSPEGKSVRSLKIEGNTTIDVSDLTNGVYIYSISDANGVITTDKFIILK